MKFKQAIQTQESFIYVGQERANLPFIDTLFFIIYKKPKAEVGL